jgi:hypothetical protein
MQASGVVRRENAKSCHLASLKIEARYFDPVVPDKRSAISDVQLHIGGPIRRGGCCLDTSGRRLSFNNSSRWLWVPGQARDDG